MQYIAIAILCIAHYTGYHQQLNNMLLCLLKIYPCVIIKQLPTFVCLAL